MSPLARLTSKHIERAAGVINHGDYGVLLGPSGEGTVTAPTAGIAVGRGPGPGITGPTTLRAGKESNTDLQPKNGVLATIEDEGPGEEPEPVRMNVTEKIVGKNESSQSELKGAEKEIRKLKEEVSNVQKGRKPQDAGVKSQAQVEPVTLGEETVSHQECLLVFSLT